MKAVGKPAAKKPAAKKPAAKKPAAKKLAAKKLAAKKPAAKKPAAVQTLPTGYELREPNRVAAASIEGYWYQILHTARDWLDLDSATMLIAEGNEDLDQTPALPGLSNSSDEIEIQIKHRCKPITQGDEAISTAILRYLDAFVHHHGAGRKFTGVLRTNAPISAKSKTEVGKWILGTPLNLPKLFDKIDSLVTDDKNARRPALVYITSNGLEQNFVDSVRWAPSVGSIDDLRMEIGHRLAKRAPDAPPNVLVDALLVRLVATITKRDLAERRLRAIDADVAISDGVLEALQRGAIRAASGGTVFVWCRKGPPTVSCAVWIEHPEVIETQLAIEARRDELRSIGRDMTERLRQVIGTLDFVAYVSVRELPGHRGMRVCTRDVVRQSRHRHTPTAVVVEEAAESWVDDWIAKKWPRPNRYPPISAGLKLAELVADSVVAVPRDPALAADIGSKLRWIHHVDDGSYSTAENPMPLEAQPR